MGSRVIVIPGRLVIISFLPRSSLLLGLFLSSGFFFFESNFTSRFIRFHFLRSTLYLLNLYTYSCNSLFVSIARLVALCIIFPSSPVRFLYETSLLVSSIVKSTYGKTMRSNLMDKSRDRRDPTLFLTAGINSRLGSGRSLIQKWARFVDKEPKRSTSDTSTTCSSVVSFHPFFSCLHHRPRRAILPRSIPSPPVSPGPVNDQNF